MVASLIRCWIVVSACGAGTLLAQSALKTLGTTGRVELVQGGFQFLEGPAKTPDGSLYFTDVRANSIYRLRPDSKIERFLRPSKHANGLMYGGDGKLLACQMDGQVVAIDLATGQETVLAATYQGKRFNACNDLVIDSVGGIYFTDPRFRAPDPWPQGVEAFYYVSPDGDVTRLGDDLPAPNGIALSPDEKTLYVVPSMQSQMVAYDLLRPGQLGPERPFCTLAQAPGAVDGGGDGLAVDVRGNLYITSAIGIQVFSASGEPLGTISVAEQPANCAFGGADNRTLYITARTGLYRCRMPVAGHLYRK